MPATHHFERPVELRDHDSVVADHRPAGVRCETASCRDRGSGLGAGTINVVPQDSNPRKRPGKGGKKGRPRQGAGARRNDNGGRSRSDERSGDVRSQQRPRKPWSPAGGQLPNWVAEQLARVAPKGNLAAATEHLLAAATHFSASKYGKALNEAQQAKELVPRDATIREILALSAYRIGQWDLALRELRTFRRFTGEATHMPVEMDVLRALGRPDDVREVWKQFSKMDQGMRETRNEGKVVFGSFLLDEGDPRRAWEVTNPKRMDKDPEESELRVWYVASRAAAALGDTQTARQIFEAIERIDTAFPGLDELGRDIRKD